MLKARTPELKPKRHESAVLSVLKTADTSKASDCQEKMNIYPRETDIWPLASALATNNRERV